MRIIELVEFSPYYYKNYGVKVALSWYNKLWWVCMPGTTIKVKWPVGEIEINDTMPQYDWTMTAPKYIVESADPNDHYRPWMEKYVGKQGIDWQWDMIDNDVAHNKLSIKFRKGKEKYASMALIKWG